jgi:uncharacterized membrane protein YgcG
MKALRIAALALAALVLPALLASATYIMSANSLDSPAGAVVRLPRPIASPNPERDRLEDKRRDDISGPCDEAEHADDPRCTGGGDEDSDLDDNSGPGSDDSDADNSGPGSADSDSDNSGPGSDSSGSGSDGSGSGSDNSGSGSDSSGSGSSGGDD